MRGMEMSRESKIFTCESKVVIGQRVKEYEAFGWELLSINRFDVSMSRETQNTVYAELVKFEYRYEALQEELALLESQRPVEPTKFDAGTFLLCFILLIFPAVIYAVYKNNQRDAFTVAINAYSKKHKHLRDQIKDVCDQSRTVFFSRSI